MHSCSLKLIDILLAGAFPDISILNFSSAYRYNSTNSRRGSVLKDIKPSSMDEVRFHSVSLIKQFNEYHSECDPLDTKSISVSIEKEFMRLKEIIF